MIPCRRYRQGRRCRPHSRDPRATRLSRPDLQSPPYCDMDFARRHIPMSAMAKRRTAVLALLSANLILFSCSSSDAPQPGTPAFYWTAAKESYATGDYQKTIEHLGNILSSQNDYVPRAQPWM